MKRCIQLSLVILTALFWVLGPRAASTLAIVVWHFYNAIFDVDVYPLNWAVVDGKVSEAYYREEHPLDLERARNESLGPDVKDPGTA
ncbi:MAG: hypothetical protein DMF61_22070 [Blastocatellia bacterium AA13]|nr:MAG: hypothetical protein DMF61_22070 [Blastocatellia bacterium AA13]